MADVAPPWLVRAASYLGFHEVGDNRGIEHFIDDAHTGSLGDPWCAIFVNACLEESGVPGTRSAAARSFEHSSNYVRLPHAALGCIVTRWRGSPTGGQGHVYFYTGENENGIVAIAGNEGDAVRRYYEIKSPVTGYWWPKDKPLPTGGALRLPVATALGKADWEGAPQPDTGVLPPEPQPTSLGQMFTVTGKCSTFGGPADTGMKSDEGLAIFDSADRMHQYGAGDLLLKNSAFPGLGRSLNPLKYYLACRWDYAETPLSTLRDGAALVTANGKSALARPVDWGPNIRTGRVADISPGLATFLGVGTDDVVTVTFPAQEEPVVISTEPRPGSGEPQEKPTLPTEPVVRIDPTQLAYIFQTIDSFIRGRVAKPPTTTGAPMGGLAAALLPWLTTVLPQIGIAMLPIITALTKGAFMTPDPTATVGPIVGTQATPTGAMLGATMVSTIGIGIANWIKTKWFTPKPAPAEKPPETFVTRA